MAKKPKANNQNTAIRNAAIAFGLVIIVVAAALIWNNRSLAIAGSLDGQNLPRPHLEFFTLGREQELWGMGVDDQDFARAWAWDDLLQFHVVINQADNLGIYLTPDDFAMVDEMIAEYESIWIFPEDNWNVITDRLGFTNASFRRFVEQMVLHDKILEHIASFVVITEEDLEEGFSAFLETHALDIRSVFVHYIEVETRALADSILMQAATGTEFAHLMRQHSVMFSPDHLPLDEDGEPIETISISFTNLAADIEQLFMAYAMDEGDISAVIELANGNFAIFEVVEISDMDFDVVYDFFYQEFTGNAHAEEINNQLMLWMEQAQTSQNNRIFN